MSRSINKVILVGNLGSDPEIKRLTNNLVVANFSVATSEFKKKKDDKNSEEITEWHKIVVFNKLAEICENFLKKGMKVYVEGKIKTRKYLDKNNVEHYITEIAGSSVILLDSKNKNKSQDQSLDFDEKYTDSVSNLNLNTTSFLDDDIPF
jgi:single-strand DNA-binding protein